MVLLKPRIRKERGNKAKSPTRWWKTALKILLVIINIAACAMMITSAYAGVLNPETHRWSGIVAMAFPFIVVVVIAVTLIDLITLRKIAVMVLLSAIVCLPSLWNLCPLNIFNRSVPDKYKHTEFTLMTYNVYNFVPYNTESYEADYNPYISYILEKSPDIVCLQEAVGTLPYEKASITQTQVDSLAAVYPYTISSPGLMLFFSKFPATALDFKFHNEHNGSGAVSGYRLDIHGTPVTLFSVHLQSIGLTEEDKRLYNDITSSLSLSNEEDLEIRQFRSQVLPKLANANAIRAKQIMELLELIKKFGGPNVIVAGDFNDTPGCFSLRKLDEFGFREVYPEVGFGPMITYHVNKFYFRIDHVLYKGDIVPVKMSKGSIEVSDHYPLTTTFYIKKDI